MKYLYLLLIAMSMNNAMAQFIKEKKMSLPDESKLTYQLLNDKLNGIYSIDKDGENLLRGNYLNEKRVGNWYFLNKDKSLFARYNYDAKKLLYVDTKTLALATVKVNSGNNDIDANASVSLPLISLEQYLPLVTRLAESAVPLDDLYKLDQNSTTIIAHVDTDGKANYEVRYKIKGKDVYHKFSVNKEPFTLDWVPAAYNGKSYPSDFIINAKLSVPTSQESHRRFNWL